MHVFSGHSESLLLRFGDKLSSNSFYENERGTEYIFEVVKQNIFKANSPQDMVIFLTLL